MLIPRPVGDGTLEPVLERFVLRGVFEAGLADHDSVLALVHASDAASILDIDGAVTAVRFRRRRCDGRAGDRGIVAASGSAMR